MNEPPRIDLIENVFGELGFRVRWRYRPHWADVEVFEIVGVGCDTGAVYFERKGAISSMDHVESIDEAQPYVAGYIKWDGCSHLEFQDPHLCGVHSYKKHCALVEYLWRRSRELMPSSENSGDPSWEEAKLV